MVIFAVLRANKGEVVGFFTRVEEVRDLYLRILLLLLRTNNANKCVLRLGSLGSTRFEGVNKKAGVGQGVTGCAL